MGSAMRNPKLPVRTVGHRGTKRAK